MLYLANYSALFACKLSSCKLSSCKLLFVSLANCYLYSSSLEHWALNYGLIAHGADVDLKDFPSVRAYLNSFTSKDVNEIIFS